MRKRGSIFWSSILFCHRVMGFLYFRCWTSRYCYYRVHLFFSSCSIDMSHMLLRVEIPLLVDCYVTGFIEKYFGSEFSNLLGLLYGVGGIHSKPDLEKIN